MATSLGEFVNRTRRYMRDWPDQDSLTASVTSGSTTLSVADTTLYWVNEPLEIDQEEILVRALTSGTVLTVKRGGYGSTAASHASSSAVMLNPRFYNVEIIDAVNAGIGACWPLLYKQVQDTSLVTSSDSVYEYTIPSTIYRISTVETKEPGDFSFRPCNYWSIRRGSTPYLHFRRVPIVGSTIRINGFGPFPNLSALTDTMDAQWPDHADPLITEFAVSRLLASGEAYRVRADSAAIDNREQATKPGVSGAAAQQMLNRFYVLRREVAFPPMPKTIQSVF